MPLRLSCAVFLLSSFWRGFSSVPLVSFVKSRNSSPTFKESRRDKGYIFSKIKKIAPLLDEELVRRCALELLGVAYGAPSSGGQQSKDGGGEIIDQIRRILSNGTPLSLFI